MATPRSEAEISAAVEQTRQAGGRYAAAGIGGDRPTLGACHHEGFTLPYCGRTPLAGVPRGKPASPRPLAEVPRRTNRRLLAIVDVMAGPQRGALVVRERFQRDQRTAEVE